MSQTERYHIGNPDRLEGDTSPGLFWLYVLVVGLPILIFKGISNTLAWAVQNPLPALIIVLGIGYGVHGLVLLREHLSAQPQHWSETRRGD